MTEAFYIDPSYLTIGAPLGHGSFGVVFTATDTRNNQVVAVKQFTDASPGHEGRVLEECKKTLQLSMDTNFLCKGLGWTMLGSQQQTRFALVMRKYSQCLRDKMTTHNKRNELMPMKDVVGLSKQMAYGLQELHSRRVMHGDIKPHNALLDNAGNLVLSDFGLARKMDSTSAAHSTATAAGTLDYMAPELLRQKRAKLSMAADIWALGICMTQMLAGSTVTPFSDAQNVDQMLRRMKSGIKVPACLDLPPARRAARQEELQQFPELVELIHKCLSYDPQKRPKAGELAGGLERLERSMWGSPGGLKPCVRPAQVAISINGPQRPMIQRPSAVKPSRQGQHWTSVDLGELGGVSLLVGVCALNTVGDLILWGHLLQFTDNALTSVKWALLSVVIAAWVAKIIVLRLNGVMNICAFRTKRTTSCKSVIAGTLGLLAALPAIGSPVEPMLYFLAEKRNRRAEESARKRLVCSIITQSCIQGFAGFVVYLHIIRISITCSCDGNYYQWLVAGQPCQAHKECTVSFLMDLAKVNFRFLFLGVAGAGGVFLSVVIAFLMLLLSFAGQAIKALLG